MSQETNGTLTVQPNMLERAMSWVDRNSRAASVGSIMLIASVGCAYEPTPVSPDQPQAPATAAESVPGSDASTDPSAGDCPPVSKETIQEVEALFEAPSEVKPFRLIADDELKNKRHEIAQSENVRVFWPYDLTRKRTHHKYYDMKAPFSDYFSIAENFLAEYDVTIQLPSAEEITREDVMPLDSESLETPKVKTAVGDITAKVSEIPVEASQVSGVKKIILADLSNVTNAYGGKGVGGLADIENGNIYIDPRVSYNDVTSHEYAHFLDYKYCVSTGVDTDSQYRSLNPNGANIYIGDKSGGDRTGYISYESYSDYMDRHGRNQLIEARVDADEGMLEALNVASDAVADQVVAESEYSFQNIGEDKGEIGAEVLQPDGYVEELSLNTPVLRNKFILFMSRLYALVPGVVRYFARVSGRPSDVESLVGMK